MATQAAETLQRSVRALAGGQGAESASDQELLDRFVHQHDEAAFTALLERHGPMVLGVCRRAVRNEHLGRRRLPGHLPHPGPKRWLHPQTARVE